MLLHFFELFIYLFNHSSHEVPPQHFNQACAFIEVIALADDQVHLFAAPGCYCPLASCGIIKVGL